MFSFLEGHFVQREHAGGVVDGTDNVQVVFVVPVTADEVAPNHEPSPAGLFLEEGRTLGQLADFPHGNGLAPA